jgi:hypothetical protein
MSVRSPFETDMAAQPQLYGLNAFLIFSINVNRQVQVSEMALNQGFHHLPIQAARAGSKTINSNSPSNLKLG